MNLWLAFFPALFPPPHELAEALKLRHHGFQWVNVYRPLDYVGNRLGLRESGTESSTRQWSRFHSNYWSDLVPVQKARDLLTKEVAVPTRTTNPHASLTKDANRSSVLRLAALACVIMVALGGTVLAIKGGAKALEGGAKVVNWIGNMWSKPQLKAEDFHSATDKRPTTVHIQYFPEAFSGGWVAEWVGMGINVRVKDRSLDNDIPCSDLVDASVMAKLAESRGQKVTPSGELAYFEVWLPGIEVASDPRLFTVDEAPPQGKGWKMAKIVVGFVITLPITVLLAIIMASIYQRLLG